VALPFYRARIHTIMFPRKQLVKEIVDMKKVQELVVATGLSVVAVYKALMDSRVSPHCFLFPTIQ